MDSEITKEVISNLKSEREKIKIGYPPRNAMILMSGVIDAVATSLPTDEEDTALSMIGLIDELRASQKTITEIEEELEMLGKKDLVKKLYQQAKSTVELEELKRPVKTFAERNEAFGEILTALSFVTDRYPGCKMAKDLLVQIQASLNDPKAMEAKLGKALAGNVTNDRLIAARIADGIIKGGNLNFASLFSIENGVVVEALFPWAGDFIEALGAIEDSRDLKPKSECDPETVGEYERSKKIARDFGLPWDDNGRKIDAGRDYTVIDGNPVLNAENPVFETVNLLRTNPELMSYVLNRIMVTNYKALTRETAQSLAEDIYILAHTLDPRLSFHLWSKYQQVVAEAEDDFKQWDFSKRGIRPPIRDFHQGRAMILLGSLSQGLGFTCESRIQVDYPSYIKQDAFLRNTDWEKLIDAGYGRLLREEIGKKQVGERSRIVLPEALSDKVEKPVVDAVLVRKYLYEETINSLKESDPELYKKLVAEGYTSLLSYYVDEKLKSIETKYPEVYRQYKDRMTDLQMETGLEGFGERESPINANVHASILGYDEHLCAMAVETPVRWYLLKIANKMSAHTRDANRRGTEGDLRGEKKQDLLKSSDVRNLINEAISLGFPGLVGMEDAGDGTYLVRFSFNNGVGRGCHVLKQEFSQDYVRLEKARDEIQRLVIAQLA